jgi:hypothetical protein
MEATKTQMPEELIQRRKTGRLIGKTAWTVRFKDANPDATAEQVKTAWAEVRDAESKVGVRTIARLEKAGYTVSISKAEA